METLYNCIGFKNSRTLKFSKLMKLSLMFEKNPKIPIVENITYVEWYGWEGKERRGESKCNNI